MSIPTKDWLSPKELSEFWGIDVKTLQKWRSLQMGPAYIKIGHLVHYPIADIQNYQQNNRYRGTGAKIFNDEGADNGKQK
jgi:hypothetical protein